MDLKNPEHRRDAKFALWSELLSGMGEVNWGRVTDKMEISRIMTTTLLFKNSVFLCLCPSIFL